MEIFKNVNEFYAVSNEGSTKSLDRVVIDYINGKQRVRHRKGKPISQYIGKDGYLRVNIFKDGKQEPRLVHKLVAETFLPNPNNYTDVHHINHIKTDNRVENLKWMDKHEHRAMHTKQNKSKHVYQYTLDGFLVKVWESVNEAARQLGFVPINISRCCNGGYYRKGKLVNCNTYKGYRWSY